MQFNLFQLHVVKSALEQALAQKPAYVSETELKDALEIAEREIEKLSEAKQ